MCDKAEKAMKEGKAMTASTQGEEICHSVVAVKVNGTKCWALLDNGAAGSYASA